MKNWFVYIIQCKNKSFYVGATNNIDRRFSEHSRGEGGRYTKLHKPIKIIYTEEFSIKVEALEREKQIKGWRREKKENLIKRGFPNRPG